jgi:NAD(P)-dependent dehydrogenase (short-subunit alcohol dehydrogenase family)
MVNMFIKCLALELAESKVRVNGVASNFTSSGYKVSKNIACTEMENKIFLDTVSEIKPLQNITLEKVFNKFWVDDF